MNFISAFSFACGAGANGGGFKMRTVGSADFHGGRCGNVGIYCGGLNTDFHNIFRLEFSRRYVKEFVKMGFIFRIIGG